MFTIILRAIIVYAIVLLVFRLMGKRQLGQMQPFELVLTLIIADLATIPMAEVTVPVLHGIIPLLTLVVIHFILTWLNKFSPFMSKVISGKPVIVINPDGIDEKALAELNISIDDVMEAVRGCGYFSLEEVQYAIMETNGKMSVLPKSEFAPLTKGDQNIKAEESVLPVNIISEGKVLKENLQTAKLSEDGVTKLVEESGAKNVKQILILSIDKNQKVFCQLKNQKAKSFTSKVERA